jgi:GntR family transcriptional repressor for pyruvate dehydrogenase complex
MIILNLPGGALIMKLDPIDNKGTIVNEVLARLTQAIVKGQFKPGDQLPAEPELSLQLGVGRNSIREAIKMLSAMGVLVIRRGQGTFLADSISPAIFNPLIISLILEPKASEHLCELRIMLESTIMLMAMKKMSEDDFCRIRCLLGETEALYNSGKGTIEDFVQFDIRFHIEILKCTHNPLIEHVGQTIIALFPEYIKKSLMLTDGVGASIKNHYHILEVLALKDTERVMETVEKTLAEWSNQLQV